MKEDEVIKSQSVLGLHGPKGEAEPAGPRRLGYEAECRVLDYLRDGDVDAHDSLHSDVGRLYAEMLTWRATAQCWTPGGSEYMDPAACRDFILRERNRAAKTALDYLRLKTAAAPAWQPIETAPKDGTDFLAWFSMPETDDGGCVDHVYWDDEFGPPDHRGAFVFAADGSNCARMPGYYTHWMPLPEPPVAAERPSPRQVMQPIRDDQTPSPNPIRKEQKL